MIINKRFGGSQKKTTFELYFVILPQSMFKVNNVISRIVVNIFSLKAFELGRREFKKCHFKVRKKNLLDERCDFFVTYLTFNTIHIHIVPPGNIKLKVSKITLE